MGPLFFLIMSKVHFLWFPLWAHFFNRSSFDSVRFSLYRNTDAVLDDALTVGSLILFGASVFALTLALEHQRAHRSHFSKNSFFSPSNYFPFVFSIFLRNKGKEKKKKKRNEKVFCLLLLSFILPFFFHNFYFIILVSFLNIFVSKLVLQKIIQISFTSFPTL